MFRAILYAAALMLPILVSGCATVDQGDFMALQSRVIRNQNQVREVEKRLQDITSDVDQSRRPTAELTADMEALRQDLAGINGRLDELTHRLDDLSGSGAAKAGEQDGLSQRVARLENYLGVKDGGQEAPASAGAAPAAPAPAAPPAQETPESLYSLALKLYKQGSHDAARDRFQDFLTKYPKTQLAGNAQYWIGETFYAQKRYEEAVLAYNQVVKHYSSSSKVPAALLKEGMAFSALGDKRSAGIVFKKIVKDYPKSSEAKEAQTQLAKIK